MYIQVVFTNVVLYYQHHDLNNRYPCYFFISCAEYLQKWIIDGWVSGCCWCCRYCWCRNVGVVAEIERNLKDSFDLLPTSIDSTFCVWGRPSREASDYKCNKFMYTYTLVYIRACTIYQRWRQWALRTTSRTSRPLQLFYLFSLALAWLHIT